MKYSQTHKGKTFYAIGLSYKKADAEIRGRFSLDQSSSLTLLQQAKAAGIDSIIVTSTCNRTELYGFAEHPYQLIKLLCDNTKGTVDEFQEFAYIYKRNEAISHMFNVGSGLDSQILGDFEIINQLKVSAKISKKHSLLDAFLERLVNAVIQASKRIKTETEISSGATSVSFASVQYILNHVKDVSNKNILLFGTGKIGRNTCENLIKHTKNNQITLINRTKDKAEKVAGKFNLTVKDYSKLQARGSSWISPGSRLSCSNCWRSAPSAIAALVAAPSGPHRAPKPRTRAKRAAVRSSDSHISSRVRSVDWK